MSAIALGICSITSDMAQTTSTSIRALLGLLLLSLVSCATHPPQRVHADNHSQPPIGTFVSQFKWKTSPDAQAIPLLSVRLNADGSYLAEDLGPPEYDVIMEGTRAYPSRVFQPNQRGHWSYDERTRKLCLTPEPDLCWRWGIRNLRVDANNPDRLEWGSGSLERIED